MKRLTKFALMRPVTLLLALVTIFYFGLQGVLGSPMEMTPDINFPMMILATVYPGASPEDITETVGKKIEGAVGTLSGIDNVYTYAMENTCMNMLVYNYGTNMDTAYLDLRKSMDQIKSQLPEDAEDTLILEMDMNAMPVMQIMIQGGTDGNLRSFVNDQIVPELEKISSVAEVTIGGGRDHYIRIELIREKMDQYHLTMDTLAQIVGAADFTIPAGTVTYGDQDLNVSLGANYKSVERLKQIVIPLSSGEIIHLSDVANVYDKLEDQESIARFNGEDVVTISVSKQQSASAVDVSTAVNRELASLKAKNPSLDTEIIYDSANEIKKTLSNVFQTLILAILLAMLILFLFFGDAKASLIVGTSIPISVMSSLVCMSAMGFSMNMISVGSLVLGVGMVVDNSIVVLDSCFRQKKVRNLSFYEGALEGAGYVVVSVTGSTATTCVVFLPLALLKGMSGQLFSQFGFTIVFCMVASLLSACTIVPLMFYFLHPVEKNEAPVNRMLHSVEMGYRSLARTILPHKFLAITTTVLLLAVSIFFASRLGMELTPDVDQGQIRVTVQVKPNQDLEEVNEVLSKVEAVVSADPNVEKYLVSYGNSGVGMSLGGSSATVTAYLYDKGMGKPRKLSTKEIIASWKNPMAQIAGATIGMQSASSTGMNTSTTADIETNLEGTDLDLVRDTAEEIKEELKKKPYVTKVHSSMENAAPVVKLDIDPVKAQAEGLTPAAIAGTIYKAIGGTEVMTYTVDTSDYSVRMEYPEGTLDTVDKLQNWLLTTPYGKQIPLSAVADVRFSDSPQTLIRKDKRYRVSITADIVEQYRKTAEADMKAFVKDYPKPMGVENGLTSQELQMGDEMKNLGHALITAVFLIFIVMAIQFESPKMSLMVMLTIPFALIGSFMALFLVGCKISMIAMVGFLMLVGTVVNNGILYVDTANHLRGEAMLAGNEDVDTSLVEAGAIRIRPILMTTLTTIIAMIPMAAGYGSAGQYLQSLSLVNVGGLVASTLLSLLLLPILYKMLTLKKKPEEHLDVD